MRVELQETKKELGNDIKKINLKIENEISQKINAVYEDRDYIHTELRIIKEKVGKFPESA